MRGQISGHRFSKFLGPRKPQQNKRSLAGRRFRGPASRRLLRDNMGSEDCRVAGNNVSGRPFRNDRCGPDSPKLFRLNKSTSKFRNVRSGNPRDEWSR